MALKTVIRFISASPQCFAEDDRPLCHGSSFNKQNLRGGMISIYIAHVFLCVLLALSSISHSKIFFLTQFWSALCLPVTFYFKCFLSCSFRFNSKYVSFVLLRPVRLQLLHYTSKRRFTPQKITTRSTARKFGMGMVSKLWLYLVFSAISLNLLSRVSHAFLKSCIENSRLHAVQQMRSFTVGDWVPMTMICTVLQFLSCVKHKWFGSLKYMHNAILFWSYCCRKYVQLLQRHDKKTNNRNSYDSWRWVGLVDRIKEGRVEVLYWFERDGQFKKKKSSSLQCLVLKTEDFSGRMRIRRC